MNTWKRLITLGEPGEEDLTAQIENHGPKIVLDLDEVTLVDVDVVRFLGACEADGIEVRHSSLYIKEWILREQDRKR